MTGSCPRYCDHPECEDYVLRDVDALDYPDDDDWVNEMGVEL